MCILTACACVRMLQRSRTWSTTNNAQFNVAVGTTALNYVTTGYSNVAVGYDALTSNMTGRENVAIGQCHNAMSISNGTNVPAL